MSQGVAKICASNPVTPQRTRVRQEFSPCSRFPAAVWKVKPKNTTKPVVKEISQSPYCRPPFQGSSNPVATLRAVKTPTSDASTQSPRPICSRRSSQGPPANLASPYTAPAASPMIAEAERTFCQGSWRASTNRIVASASSSKPLVSTCPGCATANNLVASAAESIKDQSSPRALLEIQS